MSFFDFKIKNLPADLASGAVGALIAIPDAIASALLTGVNPTYAFNFLMTGAPVGAVVANNLVPSFIVGLCGGFRSSSPEFIEDEE
jgi:MFS superfamily sulfate permease-like transporter